MCFKQNRRFKFDCFNLITGINESKNILHAKNIILEILAYVFVRIANV